MHLIKDLSFFRSMVSTFLKTFRQINDPKIIKALVLATLLTFVSIIIAITIGVGLVDRIFDFFSETLQAWFGKGESWFYALAQFLGGSLTLVIAYFFFAGIHGAFVGIFIDDILDAIHQKHYPEMPWQKPPSMIRSFLFYCPHSFPNYILKYNSLSPAVPWLVYPSHWAFLPSYSKWLSSWKRIRPTSGIQDSRISSNLTNP